MREFQEKKKLQKIIFSKKILVLLLFILIFLVYSTAKIYFKSREALSKNKEIKNELAQLNQRKFELEKENSRLETESGVEEEIREKFDMLKPGEKVVVIVDKKEGNGKINGDENSSFFEKIWNFLKSIF